MRRQSTRREEKGQKTARSLETTKPMQKESQNGKKMNMRIHMFSTRPDGRCGIGVYTKYLKDEERRLGLDVKSTFVEPKKRNPLYYVKIAAEVTKGCDIAHVQFEYPFFGKLGPVTGIYIPIFYTSLRLLSRVLCFKIVTTMHAMWRSRNPQRFGKLGSVYTNIVNRFVFKFSDCLITFSEVVRNMLISEGVPKCKIYLTPHGSDAPIFMNKKECKKRIGLDPNKTVLTIFGFVKRSKGHDLLVKASEYLDKDIVILIAGGVRSDEDKVYLENLKSIAGDRTVFYGFVKDENIPVILNATDVMVLPNRTTTISGVLNWSLAYRLPTIASNLPYFKEIGEKYSCILLFESQNTTSLVDVIKRLLNNKELQNRLRTSCERFQNENSFQRAAEKTHATYLSCLERQV